MKKIIFCHSPFQMIVALFIKYQFANDNDQFDIAIMNIFGGYEKFADRLREKKVFNNVYIANSKEIIKAHGIKNNLRKTFLILNPKKMLKSAFGKMLPIYDEIYYWSYDAFVATFRSYCYKKNKNLKSFVFDEGYITYMSLDDVVPKKRFMKFIEFRNKIIGISEIRRENKDGLLLFEPDFLTYTPNCSVYVINRNIGQTKNFRELINFIFDANSVIEKYDKKYIIFEEAMLANCDNIDDYSLYKEIIEKLGAENVIVKLHPRTKEDRFSKLGVKVLGSDGVPWEAIMLAGNFTDKILITIGSGSITNCLMLFGNNVDSYMLFKIVRPNLLQFDKKYDDLWNKIEKSSQNGGVHIPNTMEEFYKNIEKR